MIVESAKIIQQKTLETKKSKLTSSVHDALYYFDFVNLALDKSVAKVRNDSILNGINVLF